MKNPPPDKKRGKTNRLGRGLESLLGPALKKSDLPLLDIEALSPAPSQPRGRFEEKGIRELASSIKAHGLLQPILARPAEGKPGSYQIIAGERRWRAAAKAGLHKVPVIIKSPGPKEAALWSLLENLQREDLNPMEEARACKAVLTERGLSQEGLAEKLGLSRPAVANTLRLLQLDPKVQKMVEAGDISFGQAREILRARSPKEQLALAAECAKKGLTVKALAARLRKPSQGPRQGAGKAAAKLPPSWIKQARRRLERLFLKRIKVDFARGRGRVSFFFESERELKELLDQLLRKNP